ncbi:MAG: MmgE/PrpD family protein [Pseudomonadota bacterium]|nr:MmgE/PrpD family protein [Pseudomonadota bacterium]
MSIPTNAEFVGRFLGEMAECHLPIEVIEAAKRCLIDWVGVTIAGGREPVVQSIAAYIGAEDAFVPQIGPAMDAEKSALLNGVAAHALDFDDTHIPTDSHISAVTWAALLALADPQRHSGLDLIRAFVAGYEVAVKLSGRRFGFSLQFRWFHPSAVIGRLASSAAASVLLSLPSDQAAHAVALSTAKAAGLRASLGGMGKPMQVGDAAKDGVVCARMAAAGVEADLDLLAPNGGFIRAFVQDGSAQLADLLESKLGQEWAVLHTSFKPYACLHGIHPSIDAAREVAADVASDEVAAIRVFVAPGVKKVARFEQPATSLEAKFSVHYCVAAALVGMPLGAGGFSDALVGEANIRRLISLTEVLSENGRKMLDSAIEVDTKDGTTLRGETDLSRGHPGNPLSGEDLEGKFFDLVDPLRGPAAKELLSVIQRFESFDTIADFGKLCR